MSLVSPAPSLADFESVAWRDAIERSERPDCWSYARIFFAKAGEASSAGDERAARVFEFLGHISSMTLRAEDPVEPLKAQLQWATGRSARPDDLGKIEIDVLRALFPTIDDPELKARVGDLLWILKTDHDAARAAVEAYFGSAERLLDAAPWPYPMERIRRAVGLAASLGKNAYSYPGAVTYAIEIFQRLAGSGDPGLVAELLELLLEHRAGDPSTMAAIAEGKARELEASNRRELSRRYWHIASACRSMARDEGGRLAALEAIAESHLADARRAGSGDQPRPMIALHHMTRAIEAFRRLPGQRARVEEIQKQLPELEVAAMKGMARIATPFDVSEMMRKAREEVAGKPFADALQVLAFSAGPVAVEDLRQEVLKSARDFPLRHLASRVLVDGAGRAVGRRGPLEPRDPAEEAVLSEMHEHLRLYRHVHVVGVVEPMRQEIVRNEQVRDSNLFFILESNPFIEPGHEKLFLRGLKAGLEGDFMAATHFLIPQIENSLRKLLFDAGAPVTTIDDQGVQQLIGLEVVLRHPLIVQMLGEDAVFDLRSLLIERTSTCFRHRLAHGIAADADFETTEAVYIWWIALRLCLTPVAYRRHLAEQSKSGCEPLKQP